MNHLLIEHTIEHWIRKNDNIEFARIYHLPNRVKFIVYTHPDNRHRYTINYYQDKHCISIHSCRYHPERCVLILDDNEWKDVVKIDDDDELFNFEDLKQLLTGELQRELSGEFYKTI